MSNAFTAWVRTHVPIAVGYVIAAIVPWLADHQLGWIHLDSEMAGATATTLTISVYYTVIHWAEQHWPGVGALLGRAKQPFYRRLDTPE